MPREEALKSFTITDRFLGYKEKRDVTKEDRGVAISGSQNCIIVDGEKVGVRPGFEYVGGRSTDRYGIQGGGSWKTSSGEQIMWRSYFNDTNGVIEILYYGAWEVLNNSFSGGKFRSTTFWDNTELTDWLILVNGTSNIYAWSGATATFASATVNTLTLEGTTTWGEKRWLASGTRGGRVKDSGGVWREFTYTGGEGTTTLTGVSVDLTAFTIPVGAPIFQSIRTTTNTPSSTAKNDFVIQYLQHLFVFNETSRIVLASEVNDYTDFSAPGSPRAPGDSITLTLDETPTGSAVAPTGSSLYIQTRNYYYQFAFKDSSDLVYQSFDINPTYIPNGGATNNLAISNIKNYITMITNEPTFDLLGNILNVEGIRSDAISDDIKNYMDGAVVDEASSGYYKNASYLSLKSSNNFGSNNNILVRDLQRGHWETPWTIPTLNTFEHEGSLYAHDPALRNTFKLLQGYSDGKDGTTEGAPISAKWYSPWDDFGLPFNQKEFDVMWIDGYITPSTKLYIYLSYDFGAYTQKLSLLGTNEDVILQNTGGGLGYYSLGSRSLGGRGQTLSETGLRRFRGFVTVPARAFYELQTSLQSNGVNHRWEAVEYGFNIRKIISENNNLKFN
jgi:hypothetical protein